MPSVARGLFRWLFHSGARLEDFADRLNHVWTFGLLLISGALISWNYGYEESITCWCPAGFTRNMVHYTHKTCWHRDLYYIPMDVIPAIRSLQYIIPYHHRLPLVLCLQALLFKLPNIILYIFHSLSGLDLDKVAGLTAGHHFLNLSERQNLANQMARYIYRWCKMFPRGLPWRILTLVWFVVKCLYSVNIVMQMFYFDKFLKTTNVPYDNSASFGDAIYDNIVKQNATTWKTSPVFPHRVLCDFQIRQIHNVHRYTVQCDLHANRFSERVYIFLWVWLLFVAIVTTLSFAVWIVLTLLPFPRKRYIRRFMEITEESSPISSRDVSLVTSILGEDGVLVVKLVASNSSELLARDVLCCMSRMARGEDAVTADRSGRILQHPSTTRHVDVPAGPILAT